MVVTFFTKLRHSNLPRLAKWFHKFLYCNLNSNFVKNWNNHHLHTQITNHSNLLWFIIVSENWNVLYDNLFFKDPHPLSNVPTFAFLTQSEVYKRLLMVRLMPYQKSLKTKIIKWTIIEPHLFKLLSVWWLTYLSYSHRSNFHLCTIYQYGTFDHMVLLEWWQG